MSNKLKKLTLNYTVIVVLFGMSGQSLGWGEDNYYDPNTGSFGSSYPSYDNNGYQSIPLNDYSGGYPYRPSSDYNNDYQSDYDPNYNPSDHSPNYDYDYDRYDYPLPSYGGTSRRASP